MGLTSFIQVEGLAWLAPVRMSLTILFLNLRRPCSVVSGALFRALLNKKNAALRSEIAWQVIVGSGYERELKERRKKLHPWRKNAVNELLYKMYMPVSPCWF